MPNSCAVKLSRFVDPEISVIEASRKHQVALPGDRRHVFNFKFRRLRHYFGVWELLKKTERL